MLGQNLIMETKVVKGTRIKKFKNLPLSLQEVYGGPYVTLSLLVGAKLVQQRSR